MRDWGQVIDWLNKYDRSHLDDECSALVKQIADTTILENQRAKLVIDVIKVRKTKPDKWLYPEMLVLCSGYFFQRDRFAEARKYLNEAKGIYLGFERSGRHRLFITLWLLGIVEGKMVNHYAAYEDWREVQEIVKTIVKEEEGGPYEAMVQWYKEREEEMKVNLAETAEEVYTWLNISTPSCISGELMQWRNAMFVSIREGRYGTVYLDIQKLTEIVSKRSSIWEKAEIELACGLALHHMQNNEAAEKYVRRAVQMFFPHAHEVAVARWMLGIIQWKIESKRSDALNSWRKSIDDFRLLLERSNKENNKDGVMWYTNTCDVIEKVQEQRIPYVRSYVSAFN